jgi:peptidoglycan DL-endopeptidase CwlO
MNRRGRLARPPLAPGRLALPSPSGLRTAGAFPATSARRPALVSRAGLVFVSVLAVAAVAFWAGGSGSAEAVTTSTTIPTPSTSTTAFVLTDGVQAQVDTLTAQAQAVQAEIDQLDDQLEQDTEAYDKCQEDLNTANSRMAELRRTVADAQTDKEQRQALLAQRIKALYMSGGRDQLLQLLLTANGMEDLYKRVRLVSLLADQDKHLVSDLKESATRLDSLLKQVDAEKRKQLDLQDQLTAAGKGIQAKMAQKQQTVAAIDEKVAAVIEQERQRQKAEQERLHAEMQARIEAALAAAQAAAQNHILNGGQLYNGPVPHTDDAVLNQVVETAMAYLGIPYVWGGAKPSTGLDCSGFVRYVFKQHGVLLPHYSGYQAQMGTPVDLADIQTGDLLAFGFPVHHVGIYIGDGLFIDEASEVKIRKLSSRHDVAAIRRFPLEMRVGEPLFE